MELEAAHRRDVEVASAELEEHGHVRRDPTDGLDGVEPPHGPQIVDAVLGQVPEHQEPVAPAGRGGHDDQRAEAGFVGGLERGEHATEVVSDDAEPRRIHIGSRGQDVQARPQPTHLGEDRALVGLGTGRWRGPREAALRQKAHGARGGEIGRLVQVLGAVSVRSLGIEPVPHHQARRAQRPDGHAGPNQIRLDLQAVGPVEGDIVDQRTGPRLGRSDARFRHRHLLQRVAPLRRTQSPHTRRRTPTPDGRVPSNRCPSSRPPA